MLTSVFLTTEESTCGEKHLKPILVVHCSACVEEDCLMEAFMSFCAVCVSDAGEVILCLEACVFALLESLHLVLTTM